MLKVSGSFQEFEGKLEIKGKQAVVFGTIETASITTGNADRDESIKGKAFLNGNGYPKINFSAREQFMVIRYELQDL